MNWQFFHRWGAPKTFYGLSQRWLPWLNVIAFVALSTGLVWGLGFAPQDYQQGHSFRIMYIHVPTAILAQSCYMIMAVAAVVSMVWRMKLADMAIEAAAPIGAVMTFLALFTGAVWGKPTWGTYWVWDARLTSMLVLLFLYFGVMALRSAAEDKEHAARLVAILVLVGVINIPIIKYSVEWWNTLHQPASFKLTEKPAMPAEMWIPLLIMVIGIYSFFTSVMFKRMQNIIIEREYRTKWVREILEGNK